MVVLLLVEGDYVPNHSILQLILSEKKVLFLNHCINEALLLAILSN